MEQIAIPARCSAWLSGELGRDILKSCQEQLDALLPGCHLTRLPRGILVETRECMGPAVEACIRAVRATDQAIKARYPTFHHELGPVFTGTYQCIPDTSVGSTA